MSKQVILCVDDERMVLDSLYYKLKQHLGNEYLIEIAESGEEAIDLFQELQQEQIEIPLIISDQIMPGLKGDELLIQIHAQSTATIKILLTGQSSVETVANAVNQANLYRYITKPWDGVDLCLTVTEALRSYNQNKQLAVQHEVLKSLNSSLEQKVIDRTQELTVTNAQLQAEIKDRQLLTEKLRTSEAKIRAIFEAMTDIVLVIDEAGNIEVAPTNPRGFDGASELLDITIKQFFTGETNDTWWQIVQQARDSQQMLNFDYSLELGDRQTWFTASVSLIPNNGVIWVARNIDVRKQAEAAMQAAKEAAEAANLAKSRFLANMSHELRSPLNAILGFSQVMLRNPNISAEQISNINIIYRSGEHLLNLINQVLDLSKIEAGKTTLNLDNVDLYHLLEDLENMFRLQATNGGLKLIFEYKELIPRHIYSDGVKLRQVLINLLSNALKFTPTGTIKLQVTPSLPKNNSTLPNSLTLNFRIQDTGVGIALEELPYIFDAFSQAQAGRKIQEGTGLGLAISRKFIQLMGGDIRVNSELGKGTTFEFQIQSSLGAENIHPNTNTSRKIISLAPGQPIYKILIVDDKLVNRQLLKKFLEPLSVELKEASNGQEAIDIWAVWFPHLILMDMRMPIMDGYEAIIHIKATLQGQATAVIALTASVLEEEKTIILSTGCDDFIRKPFREQIIFDALEKHLGISYLYTNSEVSSAPNLSSNNLTAQDLDCMPKSWINDLHDAALEADQNLVLELIKIIPPTETNLVQSLTKLTRQFQFEQILELLQPLVAE